MRSLVLVLSLAVSPLGSVVCEVACSIDEVAHAHASPMMTHHHRTIARIASPGDADDDPDCAHPSSAPAITDGAKPGLVGLSVIAVPGPAIVRPSSTTARAIVSPVAWSPPHAPPPTLPLRI